MKFYKGISSIAVIGNYLPRRCGIATFTTDMVEGLSAEAPEVNCWAIAMNDRPEGYPYPEQVRFEISQKKLSDYSIAAEFLNINQIDIVSVQHEFGIFGGPAGSHILQLLAELRMPIVTTLHTVLKEPSPEYREVMRKLADLSEKLVVMSMKAFGFLREIYGVAGDKIAYIPHGIPDTPFIDPNFYKDKFNVEGKKVILTFGLISPNKGIEVVLQALPAVIARHPYVNYIVLGATHPHVLQTQGEEYRIGLQQLARKLSISDYVTFHNRFVDLKELCEYLGAADIYVTPYLEEAQITSGTLAYAMGTGKAVVSTPYWYASEMLDEGRGVLIPFNDPGAIAQKIIELLDNDVMRHAMRKKAYTFSREAVWKEVSRRYLEVFTDVILKRSRHPRPRHLSIESTKSITEFELPELKLDHMIMLTDDTGILQHATHNIPDRFHGYCTDDNARALMVSAMGQKHLLSDDSCIDRLCGRFLSFLLYAFNAKEGRFRNFMSYSRQWTEEVGSEDAHGRAIWGIGKTVALLDNHGQLAMSTTLFNQAIKAVEKFESPRAIAFSLVGIHAYLERFSGDSEVRRIREVIANKLFKRFSTYASEQWPWLEHSLNYANGKLPHALILSGQWMQCNDMTETGLRSLEWLLDIQTVNGHFAPVGNHGWYEKDGIRARFDQQPIEANSTIEACVEAFNVTRDKKWIDNAVMCFNWYLGHNDLNMPLYDPKTGGCRDGLMADGINQNEGAESTIEWLLSLMTLQKLYADEILKQPSLPSVD
ncbi:MAG: glycosyltransferase family 4 protein [Chitinispirillaceae bacterium]|nr:glycosyltransferase family 4 protein [Chitinispirillaceae bacterium]